MNQDTVLQTGAKVLTAFFRLPEYQPIDWPDGKAFAFTIIDDTDEATLQNIKPVYDYLYELGLHTTKTVWSLPTNEPESPANTGESLSDPDYRAFIVDLDSKGFEIAFHGARGGSSTRSETMSALERFKEVVGRYPKIHINHSMNKDNLYWGSHKLDFRPLRILYSLFQKRVFSGHIPNSEYFWGDVAQKQITYVRNFQFHEIDIMRVYPLVPYRDPKRSYVNYWFHSSDGADPDSFNNLLSRDNLTRLEHNRGLCIMYTHFGAGFCRGNLINEKTKERLQDVASRNGWFATAGDILDYLRSNHRGGDNISPGNRIYLELRWALEKMVRGLSNVCSQQSSR